MDEKCQRIISISVLSRAGELRRLNADCALTCRRVPLTQRTMRMIVYICILTCQMAPLTQTKMPTSLCICLHVPDKRVLPYGLAESAFPIRCTSNKDDYENFLRCVAHPEERGESTETNQARQLKEDAENGKLLSCRSGTCQLKAYGKLMASSV